MGLNGLYVKLSLFCSYIGGYIAVVSWVWGRCGHGPREADRAGSVVRAVQQSESE
jgi:hypothetical protein